MGGVKGAVIGAISGGMFGAIQGAYGNAWNLERTALEGLTGGVSSELNGGSFREGFALGFGLSGMRWAAAKLRESMIEQSRLNPNNSSGVSEGWRGDGAKLAGSRYGDPRPIGRVEAFLKRVGIKSPFSHTIFGGEQGGQGYLFDHEYVAGSWMDQLAEAYS